ncbi:MAG: peptide deformylase [Candidatus Pacebacteria bacterium]|nr:peptide deformylase [Candidatus Paceibacterota bacterium]
MKKLVPQNHAALHNIAEEITPEEFADGTVRKLLAGMRAAIKTYSVEGYAAVAIAAPQIGVAKRMFLIEDQNPDREEALPTIVAINPRITKCSKKTHVVGEGCLSVPNKYGAVNRHKNVTLEALDENGTSFTRGAGGLLAQIIQHECDHLDGTLYIDRAEQVWDKEDKPASLSEAHD